MKLGPVQVPALTVPRLGLAAFRRRLVVHLAFVLLVLATLGLAVSVLIDQKRRSYQRYEQGFRQSLAEMVLQLRHPSGQLALLNPAMNAGDAAGLAPVLLPFSAIDFDDQYKAQRAVEMAGCGLRWPDGASLCAAVGSNAYAGGFIYLAGSLDSPPLVGRERGALDLSGIHRMRISLQLRGRTQVWVAPFEAMSARGEAGAQRGRLTGFAGAGSQLEGRARPDRDFRGWLWREGACLDGTGTGADCPRRTFYSIRLPVEEFRAALFERGRQAWPPADLAQARLRVQLLAPEVPATPPAGPGGAASAPAPAVDAVAVGPAPLFDSARPGATLALSLDRLGAALQPGETLRILKLGAQPQTLAERRGPDLPAADAAGGMAGLAGLSDGELPWLSHLIRRLPVDGAPATLRLQASDEVATPHGRYRLVLDGDLRSLDRQLALEARRLSWLMAGMLAAIGLAWLLVELGLIRRIAVLTQRAAAVSYNMQDPRAEQRIGELDVADLRGNDELGILAGSLADLLQRVKDGLRREQLRAERERDMWHAVGHEIMSPLQSLMLLHGGADDPSHRYVQRMQQAVKVLYGSAPPSEALASADLHTEALDLHAFCTEVAANARYAGIEQVDFHSRLPAPVLVRAEAYALEDAVTHILRNAQRHRHPGSPITLGLEAGEPGFARLSIRNQGPPIPAALLDKVFEYGVSDAEPQPGGERRGQGLFVAKTYLSKMDGSIQALNLPDGVVFALSLRLLTP